MVFAVLKIDTVPRLSTSSWNGRTYTEYVPRIVLELISGPRMRMGLVSAGAIAAVNHGLTTTVGGLVVRSNDVELPG